MFSPLAWSDHSKRCMLAEFVAHELWKGGSGGEVTNSPFITVLPGLVPSFLLFVRIFRAVPHLSRFVARRAVQATSLRTTSVEDLGVSIAVGRAGGRSLNQTAPARARVSYKNRVT